MTAVTTAQLTDHVMLLSNPVQHYDWGPVDVLPDLVGTVPDGRPWAEVWVGAHPGAPSKVSQDPQGRGLDEVVAASPRELLGARAEEFGLELPFLTKLLAAERPLSIQVHPDTRLAREGWRRERETGLAADDPRATYRDQRAKPEMVLALTSFDALLGLREASDAAEVVDALAAAGGVDDEVDVLRDLAGRLRESDTATVFVDLLRSDAGHRRTVQRAVAAAAVTAALGPRDDTVLAGLLGVYPDDVGVPVALLMQPVTLAPGEAAVIPPGCPHAYLRGAAVEVMECSDNVVRAGLTSKHVDVEGVVELLDPRATWSRVEPVRRGQGGVLTEAFDVAAPFRLDRMTLTGRGRIEGGEPRVLLCVEGAVELVDGRQRHTLDRGQAAFLPANCEGVDVDGRGVLMVTSPALAAPARD